MEEFSITVAFRRMLGSYGKRARGSRSDLLTVLSTPGYCPVLEQQPSVEHKIKSKCHDKIIQMSR